MGRIPKGRVSTYGDLAKYVGKPTAVRAVGNACNQNPFAPHVPCHRVVSSNGGLGGFAQGLPQKIKLLKKEGIRIQKNEIVDFESVRFRF